MYGKILRIDLTTEKIVSESIPDEWKRKYWGGEALNDRLLWQHYMAVNPEIDALDEESVLICGVGPLGATGALAAGTKVKWTFKSPIYGGFGDSVGGGFFGSELRYAGYDYLVITGKAKRPVYLWIKDDSVEIRDGRFLWGKDVHRSDDLVKEAVGDSGAHTAIISPAGENLVRFACIIMSRFRSASRTGGGCVMGSKNLKAIVARGTRGIRIADPERFLSIIYETYPLMDQNIGWQTTAKQGMPYLIKYYQKKGAQPWKNHQSTLIPEDVFKRTDSSYFMKNFKTRDSSCSAGCAMACTNWWRIRDDGTSFGKKYAGETGEKVEYLALAGMMCWGADQMASYCHTQKLWDILGVDAAEMGESIGFLMHLYEMKVIDEEDIKSWMGESQPFRWGDTELVEKITLSLVYKQNGLYELLKDGVYEAARKIEKMKGIPLIQYVRFGAKHAPEPEDIRNRRTWTVAMATATRGADHLKALSGIESSQLTGICQEMVGTPHGVDSRNPYLKGILLAWEENRTAGMNSTGLCIFNTFTIGHLGVGVDIFRRCHEAVTGEKADDLFTVGERAYHMERAFNAIFGHRRKDDALCDQWMNEPIPAGCPGEGMKGKDYFDLMMDEYYTYRGMDPETGLQTRGKLEALGLEDIADFLDKRNALSHAKPREREEFLAETVRRAEEYASRLDHCSERGKDR